MSAIKSLDISIVVIALLFHKLFANRLGYDRERRVVFNSRCMYNVNCLRFTYLCVHDRSCSVSKVYLIVCTWSTQSS